MVHYWFLLTEPHLYIPCWTDIHTYVTADAFCVVGIYIAPNRNFIFFDTKDSILWTVNYTVVTFKAHTAAHAAFSLSFGLFFRNNIQTFIEVS